MNSSNRYFCILGFQPDEVIWLFLFYFFRDSHSKTQTRISVFQWTVWSDPFPLPGLLPFFTHCFLDIVPDILLCRMIPLPVLVFQEFLCMVLSFQELHFQELASWHRITLSDTKELMTLLFLIPTFGAWLLKSRIHHGKVTRLTIVSSIEAFVWGYCLFLSENLSVRIRGILRK